MYIKNKDLTYNAKMHIFLNIFNKGRKNLNFASNLINITK